jgi:hypothetical protein
LGPFLIIASLQLLSDDCLHMKSVGHESVAEQTSFMHSFRPIGLKQGEYFDEEYFTGWLAYVHHRIGPYHTRLGRVAI